MKQITNATKDVEKAFAKVLEEWNKVNGLGAYGVAPEPKAVKIARHFFFAGLKECSKRRASQLSVVVLDI